MDMLSQILFILPSYIANALPVLLGGGQPLDGRRLFSDKNRLLGSGKTVRGFLAGIAAGTIIAGVLSYYVPLPFFSDQRSQFLAGVFLAVGTMIGDALGSFIKRRMGVGEGKPFVLDTFLFVIVALVFAYPFTNSSFYQVDIIAFIVILTLILHPLANMFANKLGLKSVPW